jgi:HSP20 family protein
MIMTNVKFNSRPFEGTLNNLVDDLFAELPVLFKNDFNGAATKGFVPVNVKETGEAYQLDVIAPGFEKTDFNVSLDDKLLTISADASASQSTGEKEKMIRREYSFRSFKRTFTLDEKIDATNITASYINGVLILNLPKKTEVKASATAITIK